MDDHYGAQDPEAGDPSRGGTADEVDEQFRELTGRLMVPAPNECLVCFLMRANEFLLPSGFAMAERFRDTNAPRATRLAARRWQEDFLIEKARRLLEARGIWGDDDDDGGGPVMP